MVVKVLGVIGVIALVMGIVSHPAVLSDVGNLAHDTLNMLK